MARDLREDFEDACADSRSSNRNRNKLHVDSIGDLFDSLNVKASKADIRRWKNNSEFGSYISLLEFLHAYAQIFYEEEDDDFVQIMLTMKIGAIRLVGKRKGGQKSLAKAHCGASKMHLTDILFQNQHSVEDDEQKMVA